MLPLYKEMDASLATPGHSPQASALVIATFTGATLFSPLLLTAKTSNLAAFTMMPAQVRLIFQGTGLAGGRGRRGAGVRAGALQRDAPRLAARPAGAPAR